MGQNQAGGLYGAHPEKSATELKVMRQLAQFILAATDRFLKKQRSDLQETRQRLAGDLHLKLTHRGSGLSAIQQAMAYKKYRLLKANGC